MTSADYFVTGCLVLLAFCIGRLYEIGWMLRHKRQVCDDDRP